MTGSVVIQPAIGLVDCGIYRSMDAVEQGGVMDSCMRFDGNWKRRSMRMMMTTQIDRQRQNQCPLNPISQTGHRRPPLDHIMILGGMLSPGTPYQYAQQCRHSYQAIIQIIKTFKLTNGINISQTFLSYPSSLLRKASKAQSSGPGYRLTLRQSPWSKDPRYSNCILHPFHIDKILRGQLASSRERCIAVIRSCSFVLGYGSCGR